MVLKLASGGAQSHMRIALHMYISSRMRKKLSKSKMKHTYYCGISKHWADKLDFRKAATSY